jgi:hypothetical protein
MRQVGLETENDIAGIRRPIVGFYGHIENHTLDMGFLEKVVDYEDRRFATLGGTTRRS